MSENSDFLARYLAPDNAERREYGAPAHGDSDDVSMPDPRMTDPGSEPRPRMPTPSRHEFAPPPGGGFEFAPPPADTASPGPGRGADGGTRPLTPPPGIGARPNGAPSHTDQSAAPAAGRAHGGGVGANSGPVSDQPAPIPSMPQLDQRDPAPQPAQQWTPSVDPAERWAPRADPRGVTSAPARHIQVDEVVKKRRPHPTMGWRKAVYVSTAKLVNLGAGPHEQRLRDWTALIKSNIPGNYQIAVVSVKGGVGKTRLTAGVGTVFAKVRGEHVIALDADITYGGLGRFVDDEVTKTVREFLADQDAVTHPKTRLYTGLNAQGLEVLAGHQNVASEFTFDAQTFFDTISRLRRIYQLSLVDCTAQTDHDVFKAVLSASDALMIVGSCTATGGLAVEKTVDWLAARRGHELLKRSVIVLNDVHRSANKKFIGHITETVGNRVRAVKIIPWDAHLRDAATLDFPALHKPTQLAFMELAAELACGFPTAGALTG